MNNNLFVWCHPPEISAPQISRANCQTLSTPRFPIPDFFTNLIRVPKFFHSLDFEDIDYGDDLSV